jgi:NADH-quinone oxidoreductase subunit N
MLIPLNMFLRESRQPGEKNMKLDVAPQIIMTVLMILTLVFGLFFTPLSDFAKYSSAMFGFTLPLH